jgi:hypothetical protein
MRASWWLPRLVRQTRYPTKNGLEAIVAEIILELGFATMCDVTRVLMPSPMDPPSPYIVG